MDIKRYRWPNCQRASTARPIGVNKRIRFAASSGYPLVTLWIPGSPVTTHSVRQRPIWQGCLGNSWYLVLTNCQSNLLAVCQERVPGHGHQFQVATVESGRVSGSSWDSGACSSEEVLPRKLLPLLLPLRRLLIEKMLIFITRTRPSAAGLQSIVACANKNCASTRTAAHSTTHTLNTHLLAAVCL